MKTFYIVLGVMAGFSLTGLPTALAVFIWTIAIPFMEQFQ